ncbi:unnamed protein product [Aphanomyces euteiches]
MDHERAEADRKMFEAKEQIAKMGETMKTLNAIFKQMREDSDKVRAVELREANQKLERQVAALEEEVRHLRPLIAQNRSLQVLLDTQTANVLTGIRYFLFVIALNLDGSHCKRCA